MLIASTYGLDVLLLVEGSTLVVLVLLLFYVVATADFLLAIVLVQSNLLTGETLVTKLLIQTPQLRRSVPTILLITWCIV